MTTEQALHEAAVDVAIVQEYPSPNSVAQEMAEIMVLRRFVMAKQLHKKATR